jgi:hypothetical protein
MHLLYLGATNWIVKQVLVGPGMLNKRHVNDRNPQDIFNECLSLMWMPKNFQRLPPKVSYSLFIMLQRAQVAYSLVRRAHPSKLTNGN